MKRAYSPERLVGMPDRPDIDPDVAHQQLEAMSKEHLQQVEGDTEVEDCDLATYYRPVDGISVDKYGKYVRVCLEDGGTMIETRIPAFAVQLIQMMLDIASEQKQGTYMGFPDNLSNAGPFEVIGVA